MKNINSLILTVLTMIVLGFFMQSNVPAQMLLNELEIDTPADAGEACEYAEIIGTPGATVPAGTFFLSVDSDSNTNGAVNYIANLSGKQFGTNGTITILNFAFNNPNTCARTFPGSTVVQDTTGQFAFGVSAETYLLAHSNAPTELFQGAPLDTNSDGQFDSNYQLTAIDGFSFVLNPDFNITYAPVIFNGVTAGTLDPPDAATRFPGNTNANSAAAWYWGELGGTAANGTAYVPPLSANFPTGGVLTPGAPNAPAARRTPFDFDGDGKADASVFRNSIWYVNRSSNSQLLGLDWGLAGDKVIPDDYDGDGKTDVAVWRAGAPFQAAFYILQSSTGTARKEIFGQTGDQANVTGDWDGDGKADVAVYRDGASAGQQSFFFYRGSSNNPNGNITYVPFGLNGDKPIHGDFDGDHKQDAAVFRPSDGSWHISQSSNGQYRVIPFGLATDKPVAADYDGDGKTDLAMFRSSDRFWYIFNSSNNTVRFQPFGNTADIPVPADYDGDGKTDIAVYRDGIWVILNSSNSNISYSQFGLAGDVAVLSAYIP